MSESTKTALAVVAVIALARPSGFLLLSPKRDKASELAEQVTAHRRRSRPLETAARRRSVGGQKELSRQITQQLVELGKAVPAEAATPSLLVQLQRAQRPIADQLREHRSAEAVAEVDGKRRSAGRRRRHDRMLPLGAGAGPRRARWRCPTRSQFEGGFFEIANFIHGIDSLVTTERRRRSTRHGRLITIDSFTLVPLRGRRRSRRRRLHLQSDGHLLGHAPMSPRPARA